MAIKLVNKPSLSAKVISPTCHENETWNRNEQINVILSAQWRKADSISMLNCSRYFTKMISKQ